MVVASSDYTGFLRRPSTHPCLEVSYFGHAIAAPASVKPTESQSLIGFFVAANYRPAGMYGVEYAFG